MASNAIVVASCSLLALALALLLAYECMVGEEFNPSRVLMTCSGTGTDPGREPLSPTGAGIGNGPARGTFPDEDALLGLGFKGP